MHVEAIEIEVVFAIQSALDRDVEVFEPARARAIGLDRHAGLVVGFVLVHANALSHNTCRSQTSP